MKSEKFEVKDILKRAKLLMEYDTRKTYDENLKLLKEEGGQNDIPNRLTFDPAVIQENCKNMRIEFAEDYMRDTSLGLNIKLGIPDDMMKKLREMGGGGWGSASKTQLDKAADDMEDALDMGVTETIEEGKFNQIVDDYTDYAYYEPRLNKWFPAIEYLRMKYANISGGETFGGEIDDPRGFNTDAKMAAIETIKDKLINAYQQWIKPIRQLNECDGPMPKKDDKVVVPKEGEEPWKECCVFNSSTVSGAKYRPATKDILVPVEYGYMLLTPGQAGWAVGGSLKVYDDSDRQYNEGRWTCGSGQFKFYITQ